MMQGMQNANATLGFALCTPDTYANANANLVVAQLHTSEECKCKCKPRCCTCTVQCSANHILRICVCTPAHARLVGRKRGPLLRAPYFPYPSVGTRYCRAGGEA